jgi:hypothetical protein
MLSLELVVKAIKRRHVPPLHSERDAGGEEELLQTSIIKIDGKRPRETER